MPRGRARRRLKSSPRPKKRKAGAVAIVACRFGRPLFSFTALAIMFQNQKGSNKELDQSDDPNRQKVPEQNVDSNDGENKRENEKTHGKSIARRMRQRDVVSRPTGPGNRLFNSCIRSPFFGLKAKRGSASSTLSL